LLKSSSSLGGALEAVGREKEEEEEEEEEEVEEEEEEEEEEDAARLGLHTCTPRGGMGGRAKRVFASCSACAKAGF